MNIENENGFKKIRKIDINSIPGAIIVGIITVILTSVLQHIFWLNQFNLQRESDLRKEQLRILGLLVEETVKIEELREKAYWNKFFGQMAMLSYIDASDFLEKEEAYRTEYEDICANYKSDLYLSSLYFDKEPEKIARIEKLLGEGFNYDGSLVEEKYNELSKTKSSEEIFSEIEKILSNNYNRNFFYASYEYIASLKGEIK